MMSAARAVRIPSPLLEALDEVGVSSADLIVEAEHGEATLYFVDGRLAWAVSTGAEDGFLDVLQRRTGLQRRALSEHLRRDGIDGLVASGKLSTEELRDALLEHNARHVQHVLRAGVIRSVRSTPTTRPFRSGITFSLEEVFGWTAPPESGTYPRDPAVSMPPRARMRRQTASMLEAVVTPIAERQVGQVVDLPALRALSGFLSAAVVNDAQAIAAIADEPSLALENATGEQLLGSETRLAPHAQVEEVVVTTARHHLLVRPVARAPALSVCLLIDRERGNLGAARLMLRAVTSVDGASG